MSSGKSPAIFFFYIINITTDDLIHELVVPLHLELSHLCVDGHFFLRRQIEIDIRFSAA